MSSKLSKPAADQSPMILEITQLCDEVAQDMRRSVAGALKIGLRLIWLHHHVGEINSPGGFRAAIDAMEHRADGISRSTAYRWLNAASLVIAEHQGLTSAEAENIKIPEPCTPAWDKLEKVMVEKTQGMSLRRLLIGSATIGEESRFDTLITAEESGDKNATAILDQVAEGKLTLVQAIRALGGMKSKEKHRNDAVYLDLDGRTGQPTGLFPKCLITIANTFNKWDELDEAARKAVKASWKEVVSKLPKELR